MNPVLPPVACVMAQGEIKAATTVDGPCLKGARGSALDSPCWQLVKAFPEETGLMGSMAKTG